jgi:hypothetical protein
MGPYESEILIRSVTHVKLVHSLLFVLDDQNRILYIFDTSNPFYLVDLVDANDFLMEDLISFDVTELNENHFKLFLLNHASSLILIDLLYLPEQKTISIALQMQQIATKFIPFPVIPNNIEAGSMMIAESDANNHYINLIILNTNYHSYELQFQFDDKNF